MYEHPHTHAHAPAHVHSSSCFIVPSSMLRKLALHADDAERQRLLVQLERSAFLRGQRSASGIAAPGLLVAAGEKRRTVYDARHGTRLPGKLVRGETGAKSKDAAVNDAY